MWRLDYQSKYQQRFSFLQFAQLGEVEHPSKHHIAYEMSIKFQGTFVFSWNYTSVSITWRNQFPSQGEISEAYQTLSAPGLLMIMLPLSILHSLTFFLLFLCIFFSLCIDFRLLERTYILQKARYSILTTCRQCDILLLLFLRVLFQWGTSRNWFFSPKTQFSQSHLVIYL